jgi:hypothetical protein
MHLLFFFFRFLPSAPCLGALHFASSEAQADKSSIPFSSEISSAVAPVSGPFL